MNQASMVQELGDRFRHQIIRASAGTGKTFALSNRYLQLLASGVECQTILATTFTRKGAGEILDRIVGRLSDAALSESSASQLSDELDWNISQPRAAEILHLLLCNLHRLEIGTLDSFFGRMAKVFSLELGLPPSWELVDEQEMDRLRDQAIFQVLNDNSVVDLLHMLSRGDVSREVAALVQRTVDSIFQTFQESGPKPWDCLVTQGHLLTDSQLEKIVLSMESVQPEKKSMIKHWALLAQHAVAGDWLKISESTAFKNVLSGNHTYSRAKIPPEITEILEQLAPHCTALIEQRLEMQNRSTRDLLQAFGDVFNDLKSQTGKLRFDDITYRLKDLVTDRAAEQVSFRLDSQVQHLLLDEFQDTSLSQWHVIFPFAKRITEQADSLRSFFCVGDMKQAIFGWRGGVAEIFNLVESDIPNLAAPQSLAKSYRSSPPVIEMVNQVFGNLESFQCKDDVAESDVHGWSDWFEKHSTVKTDLPGHVTVELAGCPSPADDGTQQNLIQASVDKISQLVETMPTHQKVGVIVRTNQEVADLIFQLQQAGIPASEEGGNPITDSAAVELVLSVFQLADHPDDSIARFHLSHSPLAEYVGLAPESEQNQFDNLRAAEKAATRLRHDLLDVGFGKFTESIAQLLADHCTQRETLRLQHLVQIAHARSVSSHNWCLRPSQFVSYVRDEVRVSDQGSARVRVMTIHKAKGLEFAAVVLPMPVTKNGWAGMAPAAVVGRASPTAPIQVATRYVSQTERQLLSPQIQNVFEEDTKRKVREAMCVLYVGLTRAIHATHVIVDAKAKKDNKSAVGVLLSTLCQDTKLEPGVVYESGDPNWYQNVSIDLPGDLGSFSDFYLSADSGYQVGNVLPQSRSGRGLKFLSPSRLHDRPKRRLKHILQTEDQQGRLDRGTLIHRCFESIQWLDQQSPSREDLQALLLRIEPDIDAVNSTIESFFKMLEQPNVRNLLTQSLYQGNYAFDFSDKDSDGKSSSYFEVQNERPFAVSTESGLLNGMIDRLVLAYKDNQLVAAEVIDYKTESIPAAAIQKRVQFYQPQIASYRSAVSKFLQLPIEKISTKLVFVESDFVVNLDMAQSTVSDQATSHKHHTDNKSPKPTASSEDRQVEQRRLW